MVGHFRVWAREGVGSLVSRLYGGVGGGMSSFKGKQWGVGEGRRKAPICRKPSCPPGRTGEAFGDEADGSSQADPIAQIPRELSPPAPYSALGATRFLASPSSRADFWTPASLYTPQGPRHRREGGAREREGDRHFQGNTCSAAALTTNAELPGKPPAMTSLPAAERKLRRVAQGRAP